MTDEKTARIYFHLGLASILVAPIGILYALVTGIWTLTHAVDDGARRFGRWLLAIAMVDVFLVLAVALTVGPQMVTQKGRSPGGPSRVIGVVFEAEDTLRVRSILPGSPAAGADIAPGDLLVKVNDTPVSKQSEVRAQIARTRAGDEVHLSLDREGTEIETSLVPVPRSALPRSAPAPLFEPAPGAQCVPFDGGSRIPWSLLVALAVVGTLHFFGRRRGMDRTLLWAAGLFVFAGVTSQASALGACVLAGGPSEGVLLVGIAGQTIALLFGGLWILRRQRPEFADADHIPRRSIVVSTLLGVLYMISGGIRVGALLLVVSTLVGTSPDAIAEAPLQSLASAGFSPLGWALFAIPVVLLAPMGEEILFRGIVLPWLSRWMPVWVAIAVSGVLFGALHLQYGLFLGVTVFYGLVLGWARVSSRSVVVPIALHVLINGTATLVLFLQG